jgi:hypothetical protein
MEEVVAEATGLHLVIEVSARGGQDPDVDLERAITAQPPHLGPLDRPQELGLERQIEIADLVDQKRSAMRLLEQPLAVPTAPVTAPRSCPNSSAPSGSARPPCKERRTDPPSAGLARAAPRPGAPCSHLSRLDHERHRGRRQPFAQRVEPPHLGAGADRASKLVASAAARCSWASAVLHSKRRAAHAHGLVAAQIRSTIATPSTNVPCGRAEVGDPQPLSDLPDRRGGGRPRDR